MGREAVVSPAVRGGRCSSGLRQRGPARAPWRPQRSVRAAASLPRNPLLFTSISRSSKELNKYLPNIRWQPFYKYAFFFNP